MESEIIYNNLKNTYKEKETLLVSALNEIDNSNNSSNSDEALKSLDLAAFHYQKAKKDYNDFLQSFIK